MIGAGNMGGMMSLLFAEYGIEVDFYDPSEKNYKLLMDHAKEAKLEDKIKGHKDYKSLCDSLGSPKVFVFSIPFGNIADKTIDSLRPYLNKGDILMDASNENWLSTERRQKRLEPDGIHYIGMGVSGGYQSARHGPSISPGGSNEALDLVMPFLKKVAAKDKHGRPCVTKVGPGGSGHFVKMAHNGIEHGLMSTLCEVWSIMNQSMGMEYEEIGSVFESWNREGPLSDNYLISIGADICRTKDPKDGSYVLANVRDKVVQDVNETEGTGVWTCLESVRLHVSSPTITAAHLFRLASADASRREKVNKSMNGGIKPSKMQLSKQDKNAFLKDMHGAVYASFLTAFIQGLHIIAKASHEQKWNVDFAEILQLWRGGCIIQSDYIVGLLEKVYRKNDHDDNDLLDHPEIGVPLKENYPALKKVVTKALEADAAVPSLGAALEFIKYTSSTELPTQFMEAQMDYFGAHMYDLKSAEPGKPVTGSHHFEWKPAKGILEDKN
jgi:6-phosphogluconate dehydrogenase